MQIDHVAISSLGFDEHIRIMNSLGYKLSFIEKEIKNLKIKCKLMRQFSELQDLALLTREGSIGIELLNHRHINPADYYIFPVFENVPDELVERIDGKKVDDNVFIEAKMKCFDVPFYIQENAKSSSFQFNKLIIKTKDVKKSINFWQCFGFKVIQIKKNFALLEFNSLFSKDLYQIYLQEDETIKEASFLDDNGFNCIAFITNSAKNEKKSIEKKDIKVTETEQLVLNGKLLNIFFAVGPFGELVEMIGIQN